MTKDETKLKEKIMKFEMEIGWVGDEKITVDTHNFEKIEIIKEFIEFQEAHGWAVNYEAGVPGFEMSTWYGVFVTTETPPFALNSKEEL